jgi:signal transduction histidine kinase
LGLGAKLNFAFFTVILVMVLGHAGYALFTDWKSGHDDADKRLRAVRERLFTRDFKSIGDSGAHAAVDIAKDPAVASAFSTKDRDAIGKALKACADRIGFDGTITILDNKGKIVYSTDAPAKSGGTVSDSRILSVVANNSEASGFAAISPVGDITITGFAPMAGGAGVAAANHPMNNEMLTGLASEFKFIEENPLLRNVDLALVNSDQKVSAVSSSLVGKDGGFLDRIRQLGYKALAGGDKTPIEAGGRLWFPVGLEDGSHHMIGVIVISAPVPNLMPRAIGYIVEVAATAAIAMIIALVFSTAISGSVRQSLHFLIGRAHDLAAQKQNLAPLEGLQGEWLELGELMDTAVSSLRSSVQGLKVQLSKRSVETEEKSKQEDYSSEQLVHLNRQLSEKTRQIAELSKQINFCTQQSVVLQQKLDAVLQISTEGFLMLDQFGNVLSANPVFLNWMGVKEGEIAGRLCFDLVKRPGEPRGDGAAQAFSRHSGNPGDLINQFYPEGIVYHRYQEKSVEVLAHLHPVVAEDQNILGWIMVLRDKSLRSEVAQLRTEIVAMLSDSIRAPLISVETTWKTLLSNAAQTMHPSVGQALAQLHTHYEQLIGLVDSLLMMYGGIVPPPVIPREPVVVTRMVAECLEEVATIAREHQLSLDYKTVTGLPNLNTDREALKRVVLQLLEKMIAITAPGGRVRVESLVKGQEMRIGVTSSGPAIAQEDIEEMFVGFIEGKHDQATYSARLSLYLARNNVERLGGKIWAESEAGRGTAIYFIMPI